MSAWPTRIAALQEAQGMSERRLAELAGVHRNTLRSFLHGTISPRLDHLERILAVFGCELDAITKDQSHGN